MPEPHARPKTSGATAARRSALAGPALPACAPRARACGAGPAPAHSEWADSPPMG